MIKNNNLIIKECEVSEMKNIEVKNNKERGNEVMSNFDMGKVIEVVLKAIEETRDNPRELSWELDFEYEETTLTEEEQAYCKKVLNLIEISNSSEYIEKLFTAVELDIFDIESNIPFVFTHSGNSHIRDLVNEMWNLQEEIKRDYAVYKLPYMKELLDNFMEWYKEEIDYDYLLSSVIDSLECEEVTSLDTVILDFVESELHETPISRFTGYSADYIEGEIWECFARVIDSDYILNNYWHIVSEIKKEFISQYR